MSRSERSAALEEKKRRLDALRARRSTKGSGVGAVTASKSGSLNDYIDGLLNSPPPVVVPEPTPKSAPVVAVDPMASSQSGVDGGGGVGVGVGGGGDGGGGGEVASVAIGTSDVGSGDVSDAGTVPAAPVVKVETFVMSTQTEEEDFPVPLEDEDDTHSKDGSKDEAETDPQDDTNKENEAETVSSSALPEPKLLSPEQINEALSTTRFSAFFTSASKKVERLLGAPLLSDLLVDDATYRKPNDPSSSQRKHKSGLRHKHIVAKVSFSFPRWTANRDITSIDWSPHHRGGELLLASYHAPSSSSSPLAPSSSSVPSGTTGDSAAASSSESSTAVQSLTPNPTPSSTLQPRSKSETTRADGLCVLWNLTMPSRPEHVFTCGSPVLKAKFHPTEPNLVIGACHSGQVVVWDVRSGRLPVQRSSLNIFGSGGGGIGGHVHPVVGMELLDGGSALVTASSDGRINFWSPSNLRDPAETVIIDGNISSIAIAPESQSILVGDESGSVYCVVSSSSVGTSRSSAARRVVRRLDAVVDTNTDGTGKDEKKEEGGRASSLRHYGMVTGISTKSTSTLAKSGGGGGTGVSLSRGFVRGPNGLALSCGVDWTTKLWAPAYSDEPLMNLLSHSYDYMSDVKWSPVHPSIFATASSNGTLGLWNLATSLEEPITGPEGIAVDAIGPDGTDAPPPPSSTSSPSPTTSRGLNKIEWSRDGRRIVAASYDTLHIFGMAEDVWKPKADDESRMMNNLKGRGLLGEEG